MTDPMYCTSFCNHPHSLRTGRPIGHECYILDPRALAQEREGVYPATVIREPRVLVQGRTRTQPVVEAMAAWGEVDQPYTYLDRPLWWHDQGLSQTRSGYGKQLTSPRCVQLADGRVRRVYVTQFSNAGTAWIVLDGVRRIVR